MSIQRQSEDEAPAWAPAPHWHFQVHRPQASQVTPGWWLRRAVRRRSVVLMLERRCRLPD